MPLDELLALYGYGGQQSTEEQEESDVESDVTQEPLRSSSEGEPASQINSELTQLYEPEPEPEAEQEQEQEHIAGDASRLLRCK